MKKYNLVFNFKFYGDYNIHPLDEYVKKLKEIIYDSGCSATYAMIEPKEKIENGGISFIGTLSDISVIESAAFSLIVGAGIKSELTDEMVEEWIEDTLRSGGQFLELYNVK